MKVLLVNKYFYLKGGPERHIFKINKILQAKGHQAIPFSMQDERNEPTPYAKYFVSKVDFNSSMSLRDKLRMIPRVIYFLEAKRKIEALIRKVKPDIAHLHNIAHQISPSVLHSLKKFDLPVIQTLHDYKLICPTYNMVARGRICERCKGHQYYQAVLQRCNKGSFSFSLLNCVEMYLHKFLRIYERNVDFFIAPSDFLRNKVIEFGINGGKIFHIPTFVDSREYSPQYNGDNYFVYFGRVSQEKGLSTLVEAMKTVRASKLLIIGEGELKNSLEGYTSQKSISDIKFLGHLSSERLKSVVRSSRFVVLPSEWYENCPASILEAFALGKPVIGSNIGGIPELIEDGVDGLLFEPGNSEELSEKIAYLISRPQLREQMGKNARKKVEEKYNPEVYYQSLMGIYQKLLR
ncbi:glycosyltransferase family 1 protein [Candidatus Aerophobetes bacterium]|uniref:Glycosyltransferase family 1 protein n=1 Tax=Aerophobetes bacterium TaxID=2030807 RepID=A0A523S182_UNCAE|nr:MAG: glycosyltransferase family 1 protein [Candidatus Aerophobetes bacterium]